MKALIQRVKRASVTIDNELYSQIGAGILVLLGVAKEDDKENAEKLAQKIAGLRIFEDENDKMNLSIKDINGEILVVSQFTLCGDCKNKAIDLYEYFVKCIIDNGIKTKTGKFRAMMDVELVNDGPVTFFIEK